MDIWIDIIGKIAGIAFVTIVYFAYGKLKAYLEARIDSMENDDLALLIASFVEAAEQLFKVDDPTGQKRKEYVIKQLTELGYTITSQIDALIESAVYEINQR